MQDEDEIVLSEYIKTHIKRISTWDLLREVDKLMSHVITWKPFDPNPKLRKIYAPQFFNLVPSKSRRKRPWST